MRHDAYILDGKVPVPATLDEWSKSFRKKDDWHVASTNLPSGKWISTVFLGLNHQYGNGPPLIFETMVFADGNSYDDLDMNRCSTWEEAETMHKDMVDKWSKP